MPPRRPICTILGGPNGAGKSSIHEALRPVGIFVNADAAARLIAPDNPEAVSLAAGRRVIGQLDALIAAREDFVYETTLSGHQPLTVLERAKDAGYETGLVFVVLASVDLNVDRVAQRVARGGHDIPEVIIRRRYDKALARLAMAMRLADATIVLDNTELVPSVLLRVNAGAIEENHLDTTISVHRQIADAARAVSGGRGF